ncbi:MAG: hypothetical protein ABFC95_09460 [Smithella sp.]
MKRTRIITVAFLILLICFLWSGAATSRAAESKPADAITREMNSRLPLDLSDDREEN